MALVAAPFPFAESPLPERAMPIFWLCAGGGVCLLLRLAAVSWPAAALLLWAFLRCLWTGLSIDAMSLKANVVVMEAGRARPIQLLILLALISALYVAARGMSEKHTRYAAWALCAGVLYEGLFGYLNLWRIYPFMSFIQPEQAGRPMGFLTHPNYWGSFMALGVPVVWSLLGALPALAIAAMVAASWSGGPVISLAAGVALLAWPRLARRARYALIASGATVVTAVMTVHEWRLSGRWENWTAAWPELMRYPIIGQGLGSWRIWADHYNTKLSMQTGKPEVFATLQAHSEPYQLWFELGVVGVFLAALWTLQVGLAAWAAWDSSRSDERTTRSRPWWAPGFIPLPQAWVATVVIAVVNGFGSPVFHLPGQAAIALFALARCQASAAKGMASTDTPSTFRWRSEAQRSIVNGRRRAPAPMEALR